MLFLSLSNFYLGFDLGNLASYIAVARNRGIDVIANEVSNRANPSLVSFGPRQRYIAEGAKTQETSNFKNTVGAIKRLIGKKLEDVDIQEVESKFVNAKLVDVDGEVGVEVNYLGTPTKFSATQLTAMYLAKLKDTTVAEIKGPVSDVVVSVPGYYNDRQRRALLDACQIANLNCLRLMNEITATALGYGITKTDLPEDSPRNVIIVDVGHSAYSVAAVSYLKGQLTVKATAYDAFVGGRYIDELLVDHFATVFQEKYKIDVKSNPKATFRLRTGCEKLKKILSANSQAPLNVESIMNDIDVSALMKREEFEALIEDQINRLSAPLEKLIQETGWSIDQIHSIEVVGGSSRIPAVKQRISEMFGKELSFTLNQDEAVARGCALQCAILSPVFKVRDFSVTDINSYPIKFTWSSPTDNSTKEVDVFPRNGAVPSTKQLSFYRNEDFEVEAYYSDIKRLPQGTNPWVGKFAIKGVREIKEGDLTTIKLKARANLHGIISVENAFMLEEVIDEDAMEVDPPAEGEKPKKTFKKHELKVTTISSSIETVTLNALTERENEMAASDKLVIDTEHAKNAVEEYVYEMRSKVTGPLSDFIDPSIKDNYVATLDETENWLYEDGDDVSKSIYNEKLNSLKEIGGPVVERYRESSDRPYAADRLRSTIEKYLTEATTSNEKYDHIEEAEIAKITDKANALSKWLDEELAKAEQTVKHETVSLKSTQITRERESLIELATRILSKPKPLPKPEETATPTSETAEGEVPKKDTPTEESPKGEDVMDID